MKYIVHKLLIIWIVFTLQACGTGAKTNHTNGNDTIAIDKHAHHKHSKAESGATKPEKKKTLSPRRMAMSDVGENHIHIDYGAPSVRNRVIWGGLVAYDKVWASGAHSATSITFAKDVVVNGKQIKAGKYAFFTIPGKDMWTLIINKNHVQHLADDYQEKEDIIRVKVKPTMLESPQEQLKYEVITTDKGEAVVSLSWEKMKVSFTVKND
ncbi:DUF2911 domain-containing protein [Microscilla marina]|uniref:Lipoprotein, putative n=1 Tax=Microscilla marina ATCC 23134 TaxID=313606 RepID=A1ZIH0_MICM2|nr:DUF2911 domain-containing protein [Microscilla marina]EAY29838.1 lipoprotein, putative [Microscilla marina ATCC 23134]